MLNLQEWFKECHWSSYNTVKQALKQGCAIHSDEWYDDNHTQLSIYHPDYGFRNATLPHDAAWKLLVKYAD